MTKPLPTPDGVYHYMTAEDYHADPAWGSHALKAMRKGPPARVMWERENRIESDAMRLGTAVHLAVLQGDLFEKTCVRKPDGMSFATKDGKAWRDDHLMQCIFSATDYDTILAIRHAVQTKGPVETAFAKPVQREAALFWTQLLTGERCKGRPDWFDASYIYDLKVSRHAGPSLAYRAFMEGWMHQLAHYREGALKLGLGDLGGRLVVVAPTAPHYVWALEVKADALDLLQIENEQTVYALGKHRAANDWPGTPDAWLPIEPPASALIANTVLDMVEEVE